MTPAFSINSIQNAMLSVRFPGSFAHTNIVPLPFGFSQPMEASPSHRASRRAWYCLHCSFTLSRGPSRAAIAAFWIGRNIPKSIWLRSFLRAEMISGFPMRKLILAPVTLKDLERLKNSTPTSRAPGVARKLPPSTPSKIMSLYALSWIIKISYFFANATISS